MIVMRGGPQFRDTTLSSAWKWSVGAACCWAFAWFSDCCCNLFSPAAADHVWYACAVIGLCPPMAVLGSRRPGTRVWTWFILLPMLMAMSWPLLALRLQGTELRGLHLETPQLIAFTLVLVMGVGNYCGTKYTISALIYGAATLALVVGCSLFEKQIPAERAVIRECSTLAVALAVCLLARAAPMVGSNRFDRIWFDFFDTFGIVWGRRIQDRVNHVAREQRWPVRLELEGFVRTDRLKSHDLATSTETADAELLRQSNSETDGEIDLVDARIEHTLRWLLRRFVDPIWIDARLEPKTSDTSVEFSCIRIDS